jgi:hypothetical protein
MNLWHKDGNRMDIRSTFNLNEDACTNEWDELFVISIGPIKH